MRFRFKTGLAVLAATGLLLSGCGDDGTPSASDSGGKDGSKSLTWWVMKGTNPDSTAFYAAAKKQFKKETGATLKVQEVEWADAHDKLVRAFAGGEGPDVSEIGTTWTPEFAAAGGLADLTDKITKSGVSQDLIPALKDSATYDGKMYGVGWYAGTRAIVYRTDIFKELGLKPPTNWAQLQQTVDTLHQKKPKMLPFPVAGGSSYGAAPFIWATGGAFATKDGDQWKGTVDSAESKEGLKFYTDLALKHHSSSTGASTWDEKALLDAFVKEKAVMVIQGNWTPKTALEQNPELKGKMGAFAIPGKDGGLAPTFLGGSNLAVMKNSTKQDLAWKFIKMMTTTDLSKKWAKQTNFFPSTQSQLKTFADSTDPLVAPFATAMLKAGKNVPSAPQWGAVEGEKTISQMLQSILTGTSVDEATKKASESITQTLNSGS